MEPRNGRVLFLEKWTRQEVENHSDWIVLFGDNLLRQGTAGQACIRGLKQAYGIPTKKEPSLDDEAFFTDDQLNQNCTHIWEAFRLLPIEKLRSGELTLVVSTAGLGTGLAQLDKRAPQTYRYLELTLAAVIRSTKGISP